jgi:hypothetical protein
MTITDGYVEQFDDELAEFRKSWSFSTRRNLMSLAKTLADENPDEAVKKICAGYNENIFTRNFSRKNLKVAFTRMLEDENRKVSEVYGKINELDKKLLWNDFAFYKTLGAKAYFEGNGEEVVKGAIELGKSKMSFSIFYNAEDFENEMHCYKNLGEAIKAFNEPEPLVSAFG